MALSGLTIAEAIRDGDSEVKDILLFIDNIFRYPGRLGSVGPVGQDAFCCRISAYLATEMGVMQERIASTRNGSITSVQAVYVPADDLTDPAPATTFPPGCHNGPFQKITEMGIYPAVDPLDSTSRILILPLLEKRITILLVKVKQILQRNKELQDIISILGMEELSRKTG